MPTPDQERTPVTQPRRQLVESISFFQGLDEKAGEKEKVLAAQAVVIELREELRRVDDPDVTYFQSILRALARKTPDDFQPGNYDELVESL